MTTPITLPSTHGIVFGPHLYLDQGNVLHSIYPFLHLPGAHNQNVAIIESLKKLLLRFADENPLYKGIAELTCGDRLFQYH
jgi:hypothetical protein